VITEQTVHSAIDHDQGGGISYHPCANLGTTQADSVTSLGGGCGLGGGCAIVEKKENPFWARCRSRWWSSFGGEGGEGVWEEWAASPNGAS
jgi:hypothetical protein